MSNSALAVTPGSGANVSTWARTKSGTEYKEQIVLPGEYHELSYVVRAVSVSTATTDDCILQIMAGSANYVRIRRILIQQVGLASAAASLAVDIFRLTSAGTSGTAVTPAPLDGGDAAYSGLVRHTITAANSGTPGTNLYRARLAALAAQPVSKESSWEWIQMPNMKPIIIPPGTSNGIEFNALLGVASMTVDIHVELVETSWLGAT